MEEKSINQEDFSIPGDMRKVTILDYKDAILLMIIEKLCIFDGEF